MVFHVYIVANQRNGTIYTGMTDDLARRVWEHKSGAIPGFTAKYSCGRLVGCAAFETREAALIRERRIKEWRRSWKLALIEAANPEWADLYETLSP